MGFPEGVALSSPPLSDVSTTPGEFGPDDGDRCPRLPVFVLGDSRTGTSSLHTYFVRNGLKSLHYFVEEADLTLPLHENPDQNERNFIEFVRRSGADCFTDYPTRFYYKMLLKEYPRASFILSVRENTERWLRSMQSFYGKFKQVLDLDELQRNYETLNDEIRNLFISSGSRFLQLCIDDSPEINSRRLAEFLGLPGHIRLTRDNASDSTDMTVLSQFYQLYPDAGAHSLEAIEQIVAPTKAMISEYGWSFLVNDSNDFMRVQFGNRRWSEDERSRAAAVIRTRVEKLKSIGVIYQKYIVPEKSITYREYLPRALKDLVGPDERPAHLMQLDNPDVVFYLDRYLLDARSYGQLYFRGDTHTNWLGAWFVYFFINQQLAKHGLVDDGELLRFRDLMPSIAAYDGDLTVQLDPKLRKEFDDRWGFTTSSYGFDLTIQLEIPNAARRARPVDVPDEYRAWFPSREVFAYERGDSKGLRAVVFRDSTLDFCHDLLAQHFSRSVFVWHKGLVYQDILDQERPDVVLHVMAERFVTRYPLFLPICSIDQ